jgi:hypothetical protein
MGSSSDWDGPRALPAFDTAAFERDVLRFRALSEARSEEVRRVVRSGSDALYFHMCESVARMLVSSRSVPAPERFADGNFDREFGYRMAYDARFRVEVDSWVAMIREYVDASVEAKGGAA